MEINCTKISMIRGDTEKITVSCKDKNGNKIDFVTGDTVYFTVKDDVSSNDKILQKSITSFTGDGNAEIYIEPNDTKELQFKNYVYDIQYSRADGYVKTIIRPSTFRIEGEVTYE